MTNFNFKQEFCLGKKVLSLELNSSHILDMIALNTIVNDCPSSIVPIAFYEIDGRVVLKYDCHNLLDFKYLPSKFTIIEYLTLIESLISFIETCDDWFMNNRSLYLNREYIFYEKETLSFKFIYLPIKEYSSSENQLRELCEYLVKNYKVEKGDKLQLELLKAVIEPSFTIAGIKNIINSFKQQIQQGLTKINTQKSVIKDIGINASAVAHKQNKDSCINQVEAAITDPNNIYEMLKKEPTKKPKAKKKKTNRKGLWHKLLSKKHKSIPNIEAIETNTFQISRQENKSPINNSNTELFTNKDNSKYVLKLVKGIVYDNLALEIDVNCNSFTIGRQDYDRGITSTYEFAATVKSVSRIHARIDIEKNQIKIVDLHSLNGTFVNNEKLSPNIPMIIKENDIINFSPKVSYILLAKK